MDKNKLTWEEIKNSKAGTIFHDEFDDGVRFIVLRGPASLCAYVGVALDHPLANKSYDLPISAHGGLTFSDKGDGIRPEGYYWYGWDYSHCDDYSFYYDNPCLEKFTHSDIKWLVEDVVSDSWKTIYNFKKLVKLSEQIARRGQNG